MAEAARPRRRKSFDSNDLRRIAIANGVPKVFPLNFKKRWPLGL
jgi:hypothetical protein